MPKWAKSQFILIYIVTAVVCVPLYMATFEGLLFTRVILIIITILYLLLSFRIISYHYHMLEVLLRVLIVVPFYTGGCIINMALFLYLSESQGLREDALRRLLTRGIVLMRNLGPLAKFHEGETREV